MSAADDRVYAEDYPARPNDDAPIPLERRVTLPPFPVDAFPDSVAQMVAAVAEATQTDPAMAGTSALSAMAACAGGHAEVEIRPGWREPLSLYTVTIASPGERKSAVQAVMLRPIYDVERELFTKAKPERLEAETRRRTAMLAADTARRIAATAKKAEADAKLADAIGAAMMAESIDIPALPRIVADDVTPEALASLLAEQKGRLAVISSEGGIFDIIAGRYNGHVPNLDIWLKAHSGDPIRIDRKGHPPEYIDHPTLTLGLMIQPEVLRIIASQRQFRGRGLLARFLYALPVSKVGNRLVAAAAPVPTETSTEYGAFMVRLARGLVDWLGDPAILTLTPQAQTAVTRIEADIEPMLRDDGQLGALKDWGAKYVGAVVRIAGILHLAHLGPDDGTKTAVEASMVLQAARLGAYFRAAAVNSFWEMGTDQRTADAVYLLQRIQGLGVTEVSEREMQRAAKRFQRKDDLMEAVAILVDHGYLVSLPAPESTGGRPPSRRYRVTVTEGTEDP